MPQSLCLKCGRPFKQDGKFNRICILCKRNKKMSSEMSGFPDWDIDARSIVYHAKVKCSK